MIVRTDLRRDDRHECDACGQPLLPGEPVYTNAWDDWIVCSPRCGERLQRRHEARTKARGAHHDAGR